jgi:NAD(P)H-hydrate epimerase
MGIRPLTREEVRSIDRRAAEEFGMPTLVLMENAGRGAAEWLAPRANGRVMILCGPGNNGGDGGVVARYLDLRSIPVMVVWFAGPDRLSPDAAAQRRILSVAGIDQEHWPGPINGPRFVDLLAKSDWVVDGLFGTGLSRPIEGPLREVIEAVNASRRRVLALDVPSGLDADTGEPLGGVAIRAAVTVTFVASKVGFARPGAFSYTGQVEVAGIGVPRRLLDDFGAASDVPAWSPSPGF